MAVFNIGGGGGKAPGHTANNRYNLAKPYELEGEMTPEKMANLNEMLQELYMAQQLSLNTLLNSDGEAEAASGDVVGPDSATDDAIALFDGVTGKLLQDSGVTLATLITSSTFNVATLNLTEANLEAFDGTSGTDIQWVAAPAAGSIIFPVARPVMQTNIAVSYSNSPNWDIHFAGSSVALWTAFATGLSSAVGKYIRGNVDNSPIVTAAFDPSAKAININLSAALTGAGSATARIHLPYITVSQI